MIILTSLSSNWRNQRLMLKLLEGVVSQALDTLSTVLQASLEEDFADLYVKLNILMLKLLDGFVAQALDTLSTVLQASLGEDFWDLHVQLTKDAEQQMLQIVQVPSLVQRRAQERRMEGEAAWTATVRYVAKRRCVRGLC